VAEALIGWKQQDARGRDVTEVLNIIKEQTRALIKNPVKVVLQEGVVVYLLTSDLA